MAPAKTSTVPPSRLPTSAEEQVALLESTGLLGSWYWDFSGELFWSRGFFRMLGLDPATVRASTSIWQDLIHPDDRRDLSEPTSAFPQAGRFERVARLLRPDGSLRFMRSFSEVIHDRSGRPRAVRGATFDVSDMEQLRSELKRVSEQLQLVLEVTGVRTWSHVPGETPMGEPDGVTPERIDAADRSAFLAAWRELIAAGAPFAVPHRDAAGEPVRSAARPMRNANGRIETWVGVTAREAEPMVENPPQALPAWAIRAARAALGWTGRDLAARAGVSFSTVRRAEDDGAQGLRADSLRAIRAALEAGGVTFGAEADVRLLRP